MTQALLGIDIGTSGCKALLLDLSGTVMASDTAHYPLCHPRPGWAEQDPQCWIAGARQAIAGVLSRVAEVELLCVGLSGQMHGLVPLDASYQVLRPAILWNDQRNQAECEQITETAGGLRALLAVTNNQMLPGYTGGKILWMKNHEPALFARMTTVLNPKDYLRFVLTGEMASEVSDASGTGLFNIYQRQWATDLMERIGIDPDLLPPVFESQEITGRVSAMGSELFGIPCGTPVAGGGGDAVVQTLGSGVIAPGELQTTIGTAGVLATVLDRPGNNPHGCLQMFCNVIPGKWHCMGVSLNAGSVMQWFRETFCVGIDGCIPSFEQIVSDAANSPAGANGLLFLPWLNGERCPYMNPSVRGAFIGMAASHCRSDIARAVMEGVIHNLAAIYTLMKALDIQGKIIKTSGGGARSPLWRQLQADIFGCDVFTTEGAAYGAAFGAALIAGLAMGVWPDAESAINSCRIVTHEQPDDAAYGFFARTHYIYHTLYLALQASFSEPGASVFVR